MDGKTNIYDVGSDHKGRDYIADPGFYRFVIDSLPVAVVTVSADLRITGFNPMAETIAGYTAREAMDRFCGEILHGGLCATTCPLRTVLGRQDPLVRLETTIQNRWGEVIPVRMHVAGLINDEGRLIGGVEAFVDISLAKSLERERANLISMLAHDMKSPLISIQGFALRLLNMKGDIEEEKPVQYLEIIRKDAAKLEAMANDFLELSRLQAGKLKLNLSAASLDVMLLELYGLYRSSAADSGLKLELRNEKALPIIEADADLLQRVFSNLLDNALKYARQGGKVIIETQEAAEDLRVRITDKGPGIHPNDLQYIFDPYYRGKGVGQKSGHGVGLAAVKAIVEGHGGRVSVHSEMGEGTTFTVTLPKNQKGNRKSEGVSK
jgi:PAS domain S-box-containing protein